jgi:hypothetical protein
MTSSDPLATSQRSSVAGVLNRPCDCSRARTRQEQAHDTWNTTRGTRISGELSPRRSRSRNAPAASMLHVCPIRQIEPRNIGATLSHAVPAFGSIRADDFHVQQSCMTRSRPTNLLSAQRGSPCLQRDRGGAPNCRSRSQRPRANRRLRPDGQHFRLSVSGALSCIAYCRSETGNGGAASALLPGRML